MGAHRSRLEALDIPSASLDGVESYLETLARWSARLNLTGARSPEERIDILVAPVVPAAALVETSLLDVGSGSGSPGLVLALLRPELPVTLLEPRARRWAFLREACRAAGRPGITVLRARHDEYSGPSARTVTVRALRLGLAELEPLVVEGGRALVFGTQPEAAPGWTAEKSPRPGRIHVLRREPLFHGKQSEEQP